MQLLNLQHAHQRASLLNSFCFSLTASVVMLQTMKHVPAFTYNLYELLGGVTLIVTGLFLARESVRTVIGVWLSGVLILDYTVLAVVQLLSVDSLVIRFMALALAFPVCEEVRYALTHDYINKSLHGAAITNFNQRLRVNDKAGFLLGVASALALEAVGFVLTLEQGLIIQLLGNMALAVVPKAWHDYHTGKSIRT